MKTIVVLVSGRGSNLAALLEAARAEGWDARFAAVFSHRVDAAALDIARRAGIPADAIEPRAHATRDAYDAALAAAIDRHAPDLVLLAGFMRILGETFVRRYEGRLLNIHPSLLPAFPGLHTHRRALEEGCKVAGATVHFVTPALDHGPIIAQAVVPVEADDTEATLAARVLAREHRLYPLAVRWWLADALRVEAGRVVQRDREAQYLLP